MKEISITRYKCEVCKETYDSKNEARNCESKPITKDKGVKVGDLVLITSGDGKGMKAKVTKIWIPDKYYGHHFWKRYWHTVALIADLVGKGACGSRMLLWDGYEVV